MGNFSFIDNSNPEHIEGLYAMYKSDPSSVDFGWQKFFEGFEFARTDFTGISEMPDEFKVINLINGYRQRGHLFTKTNPVRTRRKYLPTLDIENFGLKQEDLQREFEAGKEIGIGKNTLKNILTSLQLTYCRSVAIEYMHIRTPEMLEWLRERMETSQNTPLFSTPKKIRVFEKLSEAVHFEKFIHKKFPGQKSFSLEGCETLIPSLHYLLQKGSELGISEVIMGMAHRGRLNVLANIMHKPLPHLLSEFSGVEFDESLLGDVKYHLGYSSEVETETGNKIILGLVPNPSHLEAVNPIVEGIVRARADQKYDNDYHKILPLLIHGDAAISGQGVVYEVLQMSQLDGYKTGGTIHLVTNNQIGFTTNYLDGRSSVYCTDIAKTIQAPIFHVNADDVEAVVYTIELAMEYRQFFQRDVFIDLLCYRRYGHNESDEPRFTQPTLYKIIENHPDPAVIYAQKLFDEGICNHDKQKEIETIIYNKLEKAFRESLNLNTLRISPFLETEWTQFRHATFVDMEESPDTGRDESSLKQIAAKITSLPEEIPFFKKHIRIYKERSEMIEKTLTIDWAMAEQLAIASLLSEGHSVRISGQDCERGTFSHRHAVLTVEDATEKHIPLKSAAAEGAVFQIYNSPLNEYGVLGFEYGYAMAAPEILTVWEAQFGDFCNGAQIIIDQFITSAEEKWNVMNGLVLLLPHGYEGQGPEHSSARMERFLTLCASLNIQVANCSTPANYFHILRRQLYRPFRKPLVIFTPKSLLRHPKCISALNELSHSKFLEIIDDKISDTDKIVRLLFCTGKIYYELQAEKEKLEAENTAIIRIEQLYPLPSSKIRRLIGKYKNVSEIIWVQEEPENMGAENFIRNQLKDIPFRFISRPASGTPAVGSGRMHQSMQMEIIEKAFL